MEISINIDKANFFLMDLMPAFISLCLGSLYQELTNSRNDK